MIIILLRQKRGWLILIKDVVRVKREKELELWLI